MCTCATSRSPPSRVRTYVARTCAYDACVFLRSCVLACASSSSSSSSAPCLLLFLLVFALLLHSQVLSYEVHMYMVQVNRYNSCCVHSTRTRYIVHVQYLCLGSVISSLTLTRTSMYCDTQFAHLGTRRLYSCQVRGTRYVPRT